MREISFRVAGVPQPQGSKVARIAGRRVMWKGQSAVVAARVVMTEQADMKTKTQPSGRLQSWRDAVQQAARIAVIELGGFTAMPLQTWVSLSCEFVIPRPASHWTSKGELTARARREAPFPGKPDLSKLIRAVEDAMTGIVYDDDKRVVDYGTTRKRYAAFGGVGGALIEVRTI